MPTWIIPALALFGALSAIPLGYGLYRAVLFDLDKHAAHSVNRLPVRNRFRIAGIAWAAACLGFSLMDTSWLPPSFHILPGVVVLVAALSMCGVGFLVARSFSQAPPYEKNG